MLAFAFSADCNTPAVPVVCMAASVRSGYIVPSDLVPYPDHTANWEADFLGTGIFGADIDMAGAELDH